MTFKWRSTATSGLAGFAVFALTGSKGSHRLDRKLIAVHPGARYAYRARYGRARAIHPPSAIGAGRMAVGGSFQLSVFSFQFLSCQLSVVSCQFRRPPTHGHWKNGSG